MPKSNLTRWLVLANTLIAVLMVWLAVYTLTSLKREDRQLIEQQLLSTAQLMADNLGQQVVGIDRVLRQAQGRYRHAPADVSIAASEAFSLDLGLINRASEDVILSLRATDARGRVVFGPGVDPSKPITDLSDRSFFKQARDDTGNRLIVDRPLFARISHRHVMVFARRLDRADGSFAGVVYANVDTARLGQTLQRFALPAQGIAAIRTQDLRLIARNPELSASEAVGSKNEPSEFDEVVKVRPLGGVFMATSRIDGEHRLQGFAQVTDLPFYTVYGIPSAPLDAEMLRDARLVLSLTGAALVLCWGFSLALLRTWQRGQHHLQDLEQSEQRFRTLIEAAPDAVLTIDERGLICTVNPAATVMFGYAGDELIGHNVSKLMTAADAPFHDGYLERYRQTGEGHIIGTGRDVVARRKDGSELTIQLRVNRMNAPDGQVQFVGFLRDISTRIATESALAERESYYRQIFEVNTAVKLIIDPTDGRIVDANQAAAEFYGYSREQLRHMLISQINTASPEDVQAQMDRARERNRLQFSFRHRLANGEIREVDVHSGPATMGGHTMLYSIIHDVTDRNQQQRELDDLYNQAPCGYHSLDAEGRIVRINDTELQWLGYTRDEVTGRSITEFMTPATIETFRSNFPRLMQHGTLNNLTLEFVRRDGSTMAMLLSASVIRDEQGRFLMTRSALLDFSRLRRQQSTMERILAAAPMAVRIASLKDNRVNFLNQAFLDLVDLPREQAIGHDISLNYLHPEDFAAIRQDLVRDGLVLNRLVELYRPYDPSAPHVWAMGSYMVIEYDEAPAVLAWLFDVTALHKATLNAEQASAAKSRFLAMMSHEIRTPLNAIIGMGYLLGQSALSVDQRVQLSTIDAASKSLLEQIDIVLDVAKIEAGELLLEPVPFSLPEMIRDLVRLHTPQAQAKSLLLHVRPAPADLPADLIGDRQKIQQMLANLLTNAIKFTAVGHISLEIRLIDRSSDGLCRVRLSVSDTGIGIDPDVQPMLFQPFSQADNSIRRRFGGTGLGLHFVKQMASLMEGSVGLESALGQGSTFWIELPLQSASPSERGLISPSLRSLRIVAADDDPAVLEQLRLVARSFQWEVEGVPDGRTLIETVARHQVTDTPVDCVLLDWEMPGADGLETLAELRRLLPEEVMPSSVVITSHDRRKLLDSEAHAESRPYRILEKPVTASELFNAVSGALARRPAGAMEIVSLTRLDDEDCLWLPEVRVLVVDDSLVNLDVCKRLLMHEGALPTLSSSGEDGVEQIRRHPEAFDIVLMDLQMPGMDGHEATRLMRELLQGRPMPIVALTADAMSSERDRALLSGMDAFLTKPIDPQRLIKVLRQQIDAHRALPLPVLSRSGLGTSTRMNDAAQPWPLVPGLEDQEAAQRRLLGDRSLYLQLLERLEGEIRLILPVLDALPDHMHLHQDRELAQSAAKLHRLRGQLANLGGTETAEQARDIENALRQQGTCSVGACEDLGRRLAGLGVAIRRLIDLEHRPAVRPSPETPAAAANPVQQPTAVGWDEATLLVQLDALSEALGSSKMSALQLSSDIQAGLSGSAQAHRFEPIAIDVAALSFGSALDAVRKLCHDLRQQDTGEPS